MVASTQGVFTTAFMESSSTAKLAAVIRNKTAKDQKVKPTTYTDEYSVKPTVAGIKNIHVIITNISLITSHFI